MHDSSSSAANYEWAGMGGAFDFPLLLLDGFADLPADKLPPLEKLASLNDAIVSEPANDEPVRACHLRFVPRRSTVG